MMEYLLAGGSARAVLKIRERYFVIE